MEVAKMNGFVCAVAVALCALFSCSVAQTLPVPSTDPADYNFTYSDPDGCTYGTGDCRYFVAIRRNVDDPEYLDFLMEGQAQGWVAIGFSETRDMYDADVLGCIRIGDNITPEDGWNVGQSMPRNNILDSTQNDVEEHSSSFNGVTIDCLFSRRAVGDNIDAGTDLNLNLSGANYHLLYGTGINQVQANANQFNYHGAGNTPDSSPVRVDYLREPTDSPSETPTPTNPTALPSSTSPGDYTVQAFQPSGCDPLTNCDLYVGLQVNEVDPIFLDIFLVGKAEGWVAVGFTTTPNMLGADVVGCQRTADSDFVVATDTYNPANTRTNFLDRFPQAAITEHSAEYTDGRIICSFSRVYDAVLNESIFGEGAALENFDLSAEPYYILYGVGCTPAAAIAGQNGSVLDNFAMHEANPAVSSARIDLHPDRIVNTRLTADQFRGRMIRAHGILMIIAWLVFASPAILFAAWMKPALPNGEWFQVHRAFHLASLFLVLVAFILIFIAFKDNNGRVDFNNGTVFAHFVIGIVVVVLQITNPIIALFRCKPDGKYRWIFRVFHAYVIGYTLQSLAFTNIALGTARFSDQYSFAPGTLTIFWVYISYIIFFVVFTLSSAVVFAIVCKKMTKDGSCAPKSSASDDKEMKQFGQEEKDDDGKKERKRPSKYAPLHWTLLVIVLTVMIPIVIALIVLIALPQEQQTGAGCV